MNRWLSMRSSQASAPADETTYDEFQGKTYVVDLSAVDGRSEFFDGKSWLEWRMKDNLAVALDLEWVPDRSKEADNPIALMQFADDQTALLIRTHRTGRWLPAVLKEALLSDSFKKFAVGYDGNDRQKMQGTFDFMPNGIIDLATISVEEKGLQATGLKALGDYFGLKMKKESRVARSNWAAPVLSDDQVRYAAEDAYFTYIIHDKLLALPQQESVKEDKELKANQNAGVLEIKPGWAEAGIERRHDGLWCKLCEQGPMTVPEVVAKHMQGKKHRGKMEKKGLIATDANGVKKPAEVPPEYAEQGIVAGDDDNGIPMGQFKCTLCNAGPFNDVKNIESHVKSKGHQKKANPPEEKVEKVNPEEPAKDPFEDHMWNMPDYVCIGENKLGNKVLICNLCDSQANTIKAIINHLNGSTHASKTRQQGYDEIFHCEHRERLESLRTGQAVVRTNFCKPRRKKPDGSSNNAVNGQPGGATANQSNGSVGQGVFPGPSMASTAGYGQSSTTSSAAPNAYTGERLLPGWTKYVDPASNYPYYYHDATNKCQWEAPQEDCTQHIAAGAESYQASSGSAQHATTSTSHWEAPHWEVYNAATAKPYQTSTSAQVWSDQEFGNVNNASTFAGGTASTLHTTATTSSFDAAAQGKASMRINGSSELAQTRQAEPTTKGGLPPGWRALPAGDRTYYADFETQNSQWEPPPEDFPRHWERFTDSRNREVQAYWQCEEIGISFYETDSLWKRLADYNEKIYWSCSSKGIRFYEPSSGS